MTASPPVRGVILAAGYGSRFLPATKTIPKELLPLADRPSIQFIIDEFVASGIRDVLVVTSRRKKALEDYFDREIELEGALAGAAPDRQMAVGAPDLNVHFVRQMVMGGTADALLRCEAFAAGGPFVVAYPDDLFPDHPPCSGQLIDTWRETVSAGRPNGCTVLSITDMTGQDVSRYGVVDPDRRDGLSFARRMVEKPAPGTEPSTLVSLGRYLYTPDLFPVLRDLAARPRSGEFYQTEPINVLAARGLVVCREVAGGRWDTGEPAGYLEATLRYAARRPDLWAALRPVLAELLASEPRNP